MPPGALRGRDLGILLFLGAIWGVAFMFISLGLPRFSPVLFAALRFDIAGGVVLLVALWRRSPLRPRGRRQWTAIAIAAVLNVGMYHALLFWGQRFTTPAIAAVIVGLNPVITTALATWLLSDERVGWHQVVGVLLGFTGILALGTFRAGCPSLFEQPLAGVACIADERGVGELMAVIAVAAWSTGSILVRKTRHGMDVYAFTTWQMLAGALLLHIAAPFADRPLFAVWDLEGTMSLLYLAVVSSSLGFVVYFSLLERVGPVRSNLVSHVAPLFAALAGVLVLGTPIEGRAIVAYALIATGFLLVARPFGAKPA